MSRLMSCFYGLSDLFKRVEINVLETIILLIISWNLEKIGLNPEKLELLRALRVSTSYQFFKTFLSEDFIASNHRVVLTIFIKAHCINVVVNVKPIYLNKYYILKNQIFRLDSNTTFHYNGYVSRRHEIDTEWASCFHLKRIIWHDFYIG